MRQEGALMGLLDRLSRLMRPADVPQLHDPDFGHIAYYGGANATGGWGPYRESRTTFREGMQPVSVNVPGTPEGPGDDARRAYRELQRRYDELSDGIAALLFDQFDASFGAYPPEGVQLPTVSRPADILKHAGLTGVTITFAQGSDEPTFQLDYGFEWDPDHCYWVTVRQWKAADLDVSG
jgi:hypothetical protein